VRLASAAIADTATTSAGFVLNVDDGSGLVEVLLDADISFDLTGLEPTALVDLIGVLVPNEAASWQLKPRLDADIAIR
jgi:hypothetical protein